MAFNVHQEAVVACLLAGAAEIRTVANRKRRLERIGYRVIFEPKAQAT